MSTRQYFSIITALFLVSLNVVSADISLVDNGKSDYAIMTSKELSELEQYAVSELQSFLQEISGFKIPAVRYSGTIGSSTILISSDGKASAELLSLINYSHLAKEGFTIRSNKQDLVIAANYGRGLLYGVYTFLEEYLGCRWYSSSVSKIPRKETIIIGQIDDTQVPVINFREVFYADMMNPDLAGRLKLNGNMSTLKKGKIDDERHGGWGIWCHSFHTFVSPAEYFDFHPEYFPLINGKRQLANYAGQLCLTHPEVLQITIDKLAKMTHKAPTNVPVWADQEYQYWSISQMDGPGQCECPACQKLNDYEGTPMGSILPFVNTIAEKFPDKTIATLAYIYSRKAPKHFKPAKNVAIQLCGIETARAAINIPISQGIRHAAFRNDLQEWGKICNNIVVWDYVIQFQNLVNPFPNFRVLQPNVQFFVKNNVNGVFEQGNREKGGEFCELRAYVLAKLLWNPECDVDAVIDDFLAGYYGAAALPIRRYMDKMHDAMERSGITLSMDGEPTRHRNGYLSKDMITIYRRLFDQAESLVRDDPELLHRVKVARLSIMYAQLRLGYGDVEVRLKMAEEMFARAEETGLWMFSEVDTRPDLVGNRSQYKNKLLVALQREKSVKSN